MFQRRVLFAGVLAAAIGVPYLLLDKNISQTARGQWTRWTGSSAAPQHEAAASAAHGAAANSAAVHPAALTAAPVAIEEAFRFDVQPAWVLSRFPHVSTVAGSPEQLGMRVALVSGTRPDDVAGSLTYYFDPHHQLQRLTFMGQTADARRLLSAIVSQNGLRSLPTTDAAHYVGGDVKRPTSEVTVKYLPLMQASGPRMEARVDLRRGDVVGWEKTQVERGEPSLIPSNYRHW